MKYTLSSDLVNLARSPQQHEAHYIPLGFHLSRCFTRWKCLGTSILTFLLLFTGSTFAVLPPLTPMEEEEASATTPLRAVRPRLEEGAENLKNNPQAALSTQSVQNLEQHLGQLPQSLQTEPVQAIAKKFQQDLQDYPSQQESMPPSAATQTRNVAYRAPSQNTEALKNARAFEMLTEEVLPLSPDQIQRLRRYYDATLEAKATPPKAPPTPNFSTTKVQLDPGSAPPIIRLATGFISSLVFVDACGEPWKISAYSIGDPDNFNIQWDQKGNTLFIQSKKQYSHGNLAVRLWELDTPVMITLVSGQKNVDYRVDLHIPERSPDCKPPVIDTPFETAANANPLLMNLLDGIPPKGSTKLGVLGGYGHAWLVDNKIYFRTKLTVLSPAWVASVSSPDGTHVYELMMTPLIVASLDGKTVDIKLVGL